MTRRELIYPLLLVILLSHAPVAADLYRWQEADGVWNVTDTLEKIPHRYREGMATLQDRPQDGQLPADTEDRSVVKVEDLDEPPFEGIVQQRRQPCKRYSVPYAQSRSSLMVQAIISEKLTVPLILDTGATFTTLSRGTAKRLAIDLDGMLPRIQLSTANGIITAPLDRLSSIRLGEARVENITALIPVRDNLGPPGLFGLNFLNEFDWSNDTLNKRLMLEEFSSEAGEETCDRRSRQWWQKKFDHVQNRVQFEEKLLKNPENVDEQSPIESDLKDRYLEIQKANISFFRKEPDLLDNTYQSQPCHGSQTMAVNYKSRQRGAGA